MNAREKVGPVSNKEMVVVAGCSTDIQGFCLLDGSVLACQIELEGFPQILPHWGDTFSAESMHRAAPYRDIRQRLRVC